MSVSANREKRRVMTPKFLLLTLTLLTLHYAPLHTAAQEPTPPSNESKKLEDTTAQKTVSNVVPQNVLSAELQSVSGRRFKIAEYSGKVVVLNFWATWCGPCRYETPALVRLQKRFRSRGVRILELSTENPEVSAEAVRLWLKTFGVTYRVGWTTEDVARSLMQSNSNIPQTFVISPEGQIVKRFIGFNRTRTEQAIKEAIEAALK